jgi:hypothetical protein
MYTSAELQLLRGADAGASLPGIDTPTGNQLPAASLVKANTITTSKTSNPGYYYDPVQNRVIVYQDGVTLSGVDFGSSWLDISGNNVTVNNCTFEPVTGSNWYSVYQYGTGATIENSTFTGPKYSMQLSDFIASGNQITIQNNSFIDAPSDAIHILNGVVTGNYFSGAGYEDYSLAHPDAIWVTQTTSSVSITNNFIDWTSSNDADIDAQHASGATWTNNPIRITGEGGNANNITVTGNYLLGGAYSIGIAGGDPGTLTNVNVSGNYMGFSVNGAYLPGAPSTVTYGGDTIFDWSNPSYSSNAWASYLAAGVPTPNLIVSAGGGILNKSTQATTLYGAGYKQLVLYGNTSVAETNYVGGYGSQTFIMGGGANILTELAISDSSLESGVDNVAGFDATKDVIDLSRIDADLTTAGIQNFTFIGTAAFSGDGAQVRDQVSGNTTTIQAKLAGDSSADMTITLNGAAPLSAANFALTSSASASAAASAASLSVVRGASGSLIQYSYTGLQGHNYTSYNSLAINQTIVAQDYNVNASTNQVSLTGSNVTIARGSSTESIAASNGRFSQTYHPNESIQIASTAGSETLNLGAQFGAETVSGFVASGANADTIILPVASFSYLNSGMTQAQDLAAVLGNATNGAGGLAIRDSLGDTLTLSGVTATTLASSSAIHFA